MRTQTPALSGAPAVLSTAFDAAGGRPLDRSTRAFMESGFSRDFRHVRVHTGPRASAAARALDARAFTVGPDIFFLAGQYAPETPTGLRLLAHELVHVVQQGPVRSGHGPYPVGRFFDPLEREADLVAEQVLASRELSPITRDTARVIRRAITVNKASATIAIDNKAVPDIRVIPVGPRSQQPVVIAHLTHNFIVGRNDPGVAAWKAEGMVEVAVGPNDTAELAQWDFGFIQFQKVDVVNAFFTGKRVSDGGIVIQIHNPPALPRNLGRDTPENDTNPPWMNANTSGDKTFISLLPPKGLVTTTTGDHPQMSCQAVFTNDKTGHENFLFKLHDSREFVTVFSAVDHLGNFLHLAHFNWRVNWEFLFIWKGKRPIVSGRGNTFFEMGEPIKGPPKQSTLKDFLKDPGISPRLGHQQLNKAITDAAIGIRTPNRIDTEKAFGPVNIFQP